MVFCTFHVFVDLYYRQFAVEYNIDMFSFRGLHCMFSHGI